MHRVDLYTTVHKGLRKGLFDAATAVARADFARPEEAAAAAAEVGRALAFLHEHAGHEDDAILPELAALAPELHASLCAEHARTHGLELELAGLLERLAGAQPVEAVALGRRVSERLAALTAEHLRHMGCEETQANRVLWAHRSDDELRALEDRIVGSIPPGRMAEWLVLMLPAMNAPERREMLAGMAAAMPAIEFEVLTGPARAALGEAGWHESRPALVA